MLEEPTQQEAILGSGAGGPLTAPTPWTQYPGYIGYAGGVVVGSGVNKGPGTFNAAAIFINGTLVDLSKYFPYTGGTLTGTLTLASDPVGAYDAVTKRYVDNQITTVNGTFAGYLPLGGGIMTGLLTLSADPVSALHAATKQYVDFQTSSAIHIPDAPSDGTTYARNNGAWVALSIDAGTY